MIEFISLISVIIVIIMLRRIVGILPAVFACTLRWKECVKLDSFLKTSRDRDLTALALILPVMLTIQRYTLLPYRFLDSMVPEAALGVITGIFVCYIGFRMFSALLFLPRKSHKKSRNPDYSERTFFIIIAVSILSVSWIMSLFHIYPTITRHTIIWLSAAIYTLYLIRKFEFFQSSHSLFASFLYLCALEIVPTGILVVSAIIF